VFLKEGKDVLHIAFTSGLSGSYNSARIAAEELAEEYPERKIVVIDSLCAAMGEGMLLYKAVELKEQGKSFDEIVEWIENNKLHICHDVTVDDLFHFCTFVLQSA
jgi:DegV family protein with EDD domain